MHTEHDTFCESNNTWTNARPLSGIEPDTSRFLGGEQTNSNIHHLKPMLKPYRKLTVPNRKLTETMPQSNLATPNRLVQSQLARDEDLVVNFKK